MREGVMASDRNTRVGMVQHQEIPARYQRSLAAFVAFLALTLLAIVDFRRGFLFDLIPGLGGYVFRTPYFAFSPWHPALFCVGLLSLLFSYHVLRAEEKALHGVDLEPYMRRLAFVLFALLTVDVFTYRGAGHTGDPGR